MKLVILLTLGICVSLGGSSANTPAKVAAAAPKVSDAAQVTQVQIDQWMRTWRKRLSLDDWDITAEIVRVWDLKPDTLGNLRWNSGAKSATIRVLNPIDYDLPASEIPADIEYTILHELVHLQLAALPRDASSRNVEEQVVNRLSEALMALDKGSQYRPRAAVAHITSKDKSNSEASRARKK